MWQSRRGPPGALIRLSLAETTGALLQQAAEMEEEEVEVEVELGSLVVEVEVGALVVEVRAVGVW